MKQRDGKNSDFCEFGAEKPKMYGQTAG